jgi:beta-glucanase (GH16 family)
MSTLKQRLCVIIPLLFIIISCKKEEVTDETMGEETATGRPTTPPPPVEGKCDYDINETAILGAGWTKSFDESFSGDLNNWNIWHGGAFNNELQLYQAANLSVSGGNLVISARQETVTGPTNPFDPAPKDFNYTSGRIESKTNFSANSSVPRVRMMARIKLPSGYGMWPAFWSYGDPWPTHGEIDILEARGQEDFKYQTNYFYGKVANRNLVRNAVGFVTTGTSLQSCYHVYEVIWSQNTLEFYFDGVLVKTNSGGYVPALFGKTERLTLNLAVGGLFFSNLDPALIKTGTLYVDWVKVFTTGS